MTVSGRLYVGRRLVACITTINSNLIFTPMVYALVKQLRGYVILKCICKITNFFIHDASHAGSHNNCYMKF